MPDSRKLVAPSASPAAAGFGVGVAMLLTFGYEVFNFNLSLDEPVLVGAGQRGLAELFTGQGRWGMAVQYAVLPETVLPAISAGIGLLLVAGSLWVLATRVLGLPPLVAGLATAIAATLPTIAFAASFTTIAVGIGVGFAAVTVFAAFADEGRVLPIAVALAAGTLALGIYQAFAFALVVVSLIAVSRATSWGRSALRHGALLIGCFVVNAIITRAARAVLGAGDNTYVDSLMDIDGISADPVGRLAGAFRQTWDAIAPGATLYDVLQPWLLLTVLGLVGLAVRSAIRGSRSVSAVAVVCVTLVLAAPVGAALVVPALPVRSMLYLPFCIVALAAMAFAPSKSHDAAHPPRSGTAALVTAWVATAVCVMTVIANASVANRAYVSSEASFAHDRFIAMRIAEEMGRIFPDAEEPVPVLVNSPQRSAGPTIGLPMEQFGLSLFAGETWRSTSFLISQGVDAGFPTDEQERAGAEALESMPVYPSPGWARDVEGALVVNLGPDEP